MKAVLLFLIPIPGFSVYCCTPGIIRFFFFFNLFSMNFLLGNLSWQMTDEDLRALFEQYGSVSSAKIVKDKVSGKSKGFGFVEMADENESQNALTSLYDTEVMGRRLIVNEAQPKPQNSGGGG